ncbi:hypothetical protein FLONG3_10103 [Fusarium longipes]|uniref:Uncharacterized protein n=1 Tax=Fusarium longipes TaxID=694270 RepID=A0A395RRZ3_9HYPO|nr:hypothetical protein FLONG3_10103 [Fusarium longipes]
MSNTDGQQASVEAEYETQIEKLKKDLADKESELSDSQYSISVLEEALDTLRNLAEDIQFETIHDTIKMAIKRHEARRRMEMAESAATTRETSGG